MNVHTPVHCSLTNDTESRSFKFQNGWGGIFRNQHNRIPFCVKFENVCFDRPIKIIYAIVIPRVVRLYEIIH